MNNPTEPEQSTRCKVVIKLKTAEALGLIPPSVLIWADEVIQ